MQVLPKNQHAQRKLFKNDPARNYVLLKSAEIILLSQFSMSKIQGIFSKKKSFKNINLGNHFFLKTFFLTLIFEPLYFLKSCLIFDKPALPVFSNTIVSFEYIDCWPKALLFRTHHLQNYTTELILVLLHGKVKAMNALGVGWIQKENKLHHIYCCFATYFAISIWYT